MKILFLLNIGFDRGGPSVHLLQDVIRDALNQGHNVEIILKDTDGSLEKVPRDLLDNDLFRYTLIKESQKNKKGFVARYLEEFSYALKCKKIYRKNKYDVVFLQSCNAAIFYILGLKKLKCPIVFNVQDIFPQNLMFSGQLPLAKISYPILNKLQQYAYKKSDKIITISDDMKSTISDQGINANKIEVIYNWSYDDSPILLDKIPKEHIFDLGMDYEKTNVVYAGNIGKMQNVEIIAKAAILSKNDNRIHYYIIGDGANKSKVCDMINGLDNVTILPMQPSVYAESIYAQADINIIPLAKGGIKTALPSKTATVLRTNSVTLFCIDRDAIFEKMISYSNKIHIVDNSDPKFLYEKICELHNDNMNYSNNEYVPTIFSTKNAGRYVEILTSRN